MLTSVRVPITQCEPCTVFELEHDQWYWITYEGLFQESWISRYKFQLRYDALITRQPDPSSSRNLRIKRLNNLLSVTDNQDLEDHVSVYWRALQLEQQLSLGVPIKKEDDYGFDVILWFPNLTWSRYAYHDDQEYWIHKRQIGVGSPAKGYISDWTPLLTVNPHSGEFVSLRRQFDASRSTFVTDWAFELEDPSCLAFGGGSSNDNSDVISDRHQLCQNISRMSKLLTWIARVLISCGWIPGLLDLVLDYVIEDTFYCPQRDVLVDLNRNCFLRREWSVLSLTRTPEDLPLTRYWDARESTIKFMLTLDSCKEARLHVSQVDVSFHFPLSIRVQ